MLSLRAQPEPPLQKPPESGPPRFRRSHAEPSGFARQRRAVRAKWTPSMLRRVVRHRGARLVFAIGALALAVGSLNAERQALRQQRLAWDNVAAAVEVTRFVPAGNDLDGATRLVERPVAAIPEGALDAVPSDGLAAVDLVPGELLLAPRVRQPGAGVLPAGTVAITVELDGQASLVDTGSLVDVWVTDAANFSSRRIVRGAVVLRLDDRDLTIAIPEGAAGEVAVASLRPLTVTLVG